GALWYGSRRIAQGAITPGEFTSFLAVAFLMYGPVKKLSRVNAGLQQAIAAANRIFEMLDTHSEVREAPGAPALARHRDRVELRLRRCAEPAGARRREFHGECGADDRARRVERRGQDVTRESDSAVL